MNTIKLFSDFVAGGDHNSGTGAGRISPSQS